MLANGESYCKSTPFAGLAASRRYRRINPLISGSAALPSRRIFDIDTGANGKMDVQEAQEYFVTIANAVSDQFQKIPGSAIFARYVKSSYQNDPIRSAVELFLVLFAVRYLLAPKYSTKPNFVKLSEEVTSSGVHEGVSAG